MLDQARSLECKELLTYLETARPCASTNLFHVFAIILIIQHKTQDVTKSKLCTEALYSFPGLTVYHPSLSTLLLAFDQQGQTSLDFDDCLILATMKELQTDSIVSFDAHFKKVKGIKIFSPREALNFLRTPPKSLRTSSP